MCLVGRPISLPPTHGQFGRRPPPRMKALLSGPTNGQIIWFSSPNSSRRYTVLSAAARMESAGGRGTQHGTMTGAVEATLWSGAWTLMRSRRGEIRTERKRPNDGTGSSIGS